MPRKLHKTLRFRLTLWNTLVVLLASLLALLAVREAMRLTIEKEAKELLREEAIELELAISKLLPDRASIVEEFERKVQGHSQHSWFAGLIEQDEWVWQSQNFPDHWNEQGELQTSQDFSYRRTRDWLLVNHQMATADGFHFQIVLGEPIQFIRNDVWTLTKTMLLIGLGLLIVAPIGGYFLARHATKPVRQIIETTRSLEPARLNSRLPIRGTGDELDQISTEINSFVDDISRYINSQREFVANAAHELRSPITAIQTSVEVTLGKQRSAEEYQDELETVSEQCQQLRHLVNQLLELAESDAAMEHLTFGPVNLTELIEKSVSVFSGVADEKGIDVKVKLHPSLFINGEQSKLRQVINNLLDNALKFSPVDGHLSIELSKIGGKAILVFQDSGPGVADAHVDKIFDRFFQVDRSRQRDDRRGNGLGLSICKSNVELHRGKITAQNTSGGLAVRVWFDVVESR